MFALESAIIQFIGAVARRAFDAFRARRIACFDGRVVLKAHSDKVVSFFQMRFERSATASARGPLCPRQQLPSNGSSCKKDVASFLQRSVRQSTFVQRETSPMRRTPRPFVTEFKSRASRSAPPRLREESDAPTPAPTPRPAPPVHDFEALSAGAPLDYEAAMRAADALFAGRVEVVQSLAPQPEIPQPTGRILPSLIEEPIFVAPAHVEEAPRRRGRKPILDKLPPVRRVKKPKATEVDFDVDALSWITPDEEDEPSVAPVVAGAETGPRHERRAAMKRRELDAKLKPGERWKRRLCPAAR
jgi:hypothetical protein